jgi:ABC-type sugar transport system ATPase subunit
MLPEDRKHLGLLLEHEVYKNITISSIQQFISNMILSKTRELAATRQIVERLDLKISSPYQSVKYLSGGNQQKVVIGKWLTANPKILIMDEPTRGIDVGSKSEVYNIMRRLAEEGTCIIFVSSEVPEIVEIADRILVMKKGRISAEYAHGVTQNEIMQAILAGE